MVEEQTNHETSMKQLNKQSKKLAWRNLEVIYFSKTSVDFQWPTWHHIHEYRFLHNHRCEDNLKSCIKVHYRNFILTRALLYRRFSTSGIHYIGNSFALKQIRILKYCRHATIRVYFSSEIWLVTTHSPVHKAEHETCLYNTAMHTEIRGIKIVKKL
jgi:hypothetical protein